jgi:hypothetical protein
MGATANGLAASIAATVRLEQALGGWQPPDPFSP